MLNLKGCNFGKKSLNSFRKQKKQKDKFISYSIVQANYYLLSIANS